MSDFKAKMHQIRFRLGLRPRPRWGSLQRSPIPLAGFKGPTSKGRRRERRGGVDKGGEGRREGRAGEGKFAPPPQNIFGLTPLLKATLALPSLSLTSSSVPPVLLTTLPRYVNSEISSKNVLCIRGGKNSWLSWKRYIGLRHRAIVTMGH